VLQCVVVCCNVLQCVYLKIVLCLWKLFPKKKRIRLDLFGNYFQKKNRLVLFGNYFQNRLDLEIIRVDVFECVAMCLSVLQCV